MVMTELEELLNSWSWTSTTAYWKIEFILVKAMSIKQCINPKSTSIENGDRFKDSEVMEDMRLLGFKRADALSFTTVSTLLGSMWSSVCAGA